MLSKSICRACRAKFAAEPPSIVAQNHVISRLSIRSFSECISAAASLPTQQALPSLSLRHHSFAFKTVRFSPGRPQYLPTSSTWSFQGKSFQASARGFQRRYQSTSSTAAPTASLSPADLASPSPELLPDAAEHASLAGSVYDQWYVGYLKELGVDFGWGTSSIVQWLFEHVHVYATSSMGASIVATALLIRVCTLPTVWAAADTSARLGALVSVTKPIQDRMKQAGADKDTVALQSARQEMAQVRRDADVKLWKSFLPLIQIPLGIGTWRLLRNMSDIPVPGMEIGGFWWFPNLAVHDPYFILPIATGLIQHLAMRLGGDTGEMSEASRKMRMIFVYMMPMLAPIFIGFAPAAVQLSFCTTASLTFCTTYALRRPAIRQLLNLPPIIRRATTTEAPYRGNMTVSSRLSDHPVNVKAAAQARAATKPSVSERLNTLRPSSIRRGFSNLGSTVTDFVGEVMPSAQQRARSNAEKKEKSGAERYETKRTAEIEKQKIKADRKQRRKQSR